MPNTATKRVTFPNPCCSCGFCCLAMQCLVSTGMYGRRDECPALSFDEDKAICALAKPNGPVPVGDGCCIAARAFKDGIEYDFASLPDEVKRNVVRHYREG